MRPPALVSLKDFPYLSLMDMDFDKYLPPDEPDETPAAAPEDGPKQTASQLKAEKELYVRVCVPRPGNHAGTGRMYIEPYLWFLMLRKCGGEPLVREHLARLADELVDLKGKAFFREMAARCRALVGIRSRPE